MIPAELPAATKEAETLAQFRRYFRELAGPPRRRTEYHCIGSFAQARKQGGELGWACCGAWFQGQNDPVIIRTLEQLDSRNQPGEALGQALVDQPGNGLVERFSGQQAALNRHHGVARAAVKADLSLLVQVQPQPEPVAQATRRGQGRLEDTIALQVRPLQGLAEDGLFQRQLGLGSGVLQVAAAAAAVQRAGRVDALVRGFHYPEQVSLLMVAVLFGEADGHGFTGQDTGGHHHHPVFQPAQPLAAGNNLVYGERAFHGPHYRRFAAGMLWK